MGNVLIAGASGLTGQQVVKLLLADPHCTRLISIVRKPTGITDQKLMEIVSDLSNPQEINLGQQIDECFLCLGSTIAKAGSKEAFERIDRTVVTAIANLAIKAGAKTCALISAAGADANSSIFYNQIKGKTEDDLSKLGFSKLLIFRPGLLLGDRKEHRLAERISQSLMGLWTQKVFGKYASIHVSQLAQAMVLSTYDDSLGSTILHFPEMKKYLQ